MLDQLIKDSVGKVICVDLVELVKTLDGSIDWGDDEWYEEMFINEITSCTSHVLWILNDGLRCPLNVLVQGRVNHETWMPEKVIRMGNGHHRLMAALLCGVTEIHIYVTDNTEFAISELEQSVGMPFDDDVYAALNDIQYECVIGSE